jgi:CheY-like chemotaxis protein
MSNGELKRVLLVEDNGDTLAALELLLGLDGYEVRTANDGSQGYRVFLECCPDVVITDLNMPSIDGLELIRMIRADRNCPKKTPIIVISADSGHGETVKAAGANYFLSKPYDYDQLKGVIDTITADQSNGLAA